VDGFITLHAHVSYRSWLASNVPTKNIKHKATKLFILLKFRIQFWNLLCSSTLGWHVWSCIT